MSRHLLPVATVLALTCGLGLASSSSGSSDGPNAVTPPRPADLEASPRDTWRRDFPNDATELVKDLDAWFAMNPKQRLHVQLDRPLYRPGDTISFRAWDFATRGLAPQGQAPTVQLLDPRGIVVQTQSALQATFSLDPGVSGGAWKVRATAWDGSQVERSFVVASFQAPKIKKTLEFALDSYSPADPVEAALTLERATGEPLADTAVSAVIHAGETDLEPVEATTDARGEVLIRFTLPAELQSPDVLLTVLVEDGGVTESISRPVPVVLNQVRVAFYPEGGDLVTGLPSRVYFEATDASGQPAEVRGQILDDRGRLITRFGSWVDGRGTFELVPQPGRTYHARIDTPADLEETDTPLPAAVAQGCVLHHYDDFEGVQQAVRVGVTCTDARDVMVLASQQEQLIDRAVIPVRGFAETTVHLRSADPALSGAQGVARVTVFGMDLEPLAERLVYRNKSRSLQVSMRADRDHYAPGDPVVLTVSTRDPSGEPVPAELAVSVVDDALLAYADDDAPSLVPHVLLQADLPEPIEGIDHLFAAGAEDGGLGVDLALGTRGWRRFDWTTVRGAFARQLQAAARPAYWEYASLGYAVEEDGGWDEIPMADAPPMMEPMAVAEAPRGGAVRKKPRATAATRSDAVSAPEATVPVREFAQAQTKAPVTEDPAPRSDFRDTVLWQPAVRTGANGVAKVRFELSDAVTGFRAVAEGVGDGWLGRGETLISSTLPFHIETHLPVALSTGDQVLLPVTLANQRETALDVALSGRFSALLSRSDMADRIALAPGERRTVHIPLTATPGRGMADLDLRADAGPFQDALQQHISIEPRGFPLDWTASGRLDGRATHTVEVSEAIDGSIEGQLTLFPSAVSEVLTGIETMVRTPGGCFEQTSSTNYPNVVVLDLLEQAGGGAKLAVDRKQVLDTGYHILTGYQVGSGGFETWGSGPGKEALSAYGLLEFSQMSRVYDVDPKIIEHNVDYLYGQRDGKGGYAVTGSSAHGYGTAPPEVLDAYITYALVETGHTDLRAEIAKSASLARSSNDPYRLALATLALLKADPAAGRVGAERLAKLQADDGSFPGSETSITRSENYNLLVEATALSTMALVRSGDLAGAQDGLRWLHGNQTGGGVWGATQGNALALQAIGEVARASSRRGGDGRLTVTIDGEVAAQQVIAANAHDPVVLDLSKWLDEGSHEVQLDLDGASMPYSLEVGWSSETPRSADDRRVDLQTHLADAEVGMGHTTRMTATLSNRTERVVPDPIARIGLPAGLVPQTWQLEQLVDRGVIAFFETRPREVTLYWDGISPDEVHEVALDLVAEVPGTFTAPASSAYPYYDDQAKAWVAGPSVRVTP